MHFFTRYILRLIIKIRSKDKVLHLYLRKVKNFLDKIPEYTAVIALTYTTHTEMDMITKFDHRWTRYLF